MPPARLYPLVVLTGFAIAACVATRPSPPPLGTQSGQPSQRAAGTRGTTSDPEAMGGAARAAKTLRDMLSRLGPEAAKPPPPASPEPPVPEPPEPEEALSRPERQWRWIAEASDESCRQILSESKADFVSLPDAETPNDKGCGIPRGVVLRRGVTGVRYSPALRVDCSFALRLGEVEGILAEEAQARFGTEVARIGHIGTYVCRGVVGRLRGRSGGISEHSFGNAVDVTHFDLATGSRISVLHHYDNEGAAARPHRDLLRSVLSRVRRETDLRGLGPDFDASHRSHFHFDAGSRWWRPWKRRR